MRSAFILLALLAVWTPAPAATIHVPEDYSTIQKALNAAVDEDIILVAPGKYVENIDFLGKAVQVLSIQGASETIIDGNQEGRVVTFANQEESSAALEGFTITNGNGGIYCLISSPTIRNNTIAVNSTSIGGGIYCMLASPLITDNRFIGNTAISDGGGICCIEGSHPIITGNLFSGNTAGEWGGGICCFYHCNPSITNNMLFGNTAEEGGALFNGILTGSRITNNTIYGNSASLNGGGVYCHNEFMTITNTILWNNTAPQGAQVFIRYGSPDITYCDIQGGLPGPGNLDAQPLFVDAAAGDFHLFFDSPCRESGTLSAPAMPEKDFEGDPRPAYALADIGADEFHRHLYFTGDATPGGHVDVKLTGSPAATPVMLWIGSSVFNPPLITAFGIWYLMPPIMLTATLGSLPSPGGVLTLSAVIPKDFPSLDVPMQVLIGNQLTNLCLMPVRK